MHWGYLLFCIWFSYLLGMFYGSINSTEKCSTFLYNTVEMQFMKKVTLLVTHICRTKPKKMWNNQLFGPIKFCFLHVIYNTHALPDTCVNRSSRVLYAFHRQGPSSLCPDNGWTLLPPNHYCLDLFSGLTSCSCLKLSAWSKRTKMCKRVMGSEMCHELCATWGILVCWATWDTNHFFTITYCCLLHANFKNRLNLQ